MCEIHSKTTYTVQIEVDSAAQLAALLRVVPDGYVTSVRALHEFVGVL